MRIKLTFLGLEISYTTCWFDGEGMSWDSSQLESVFEPVFALTALHIVLLADRE